MRHTRNAKAAKFEHPGQFSGRGGNEGAVDLLKRKGFDVDDRWLTTREETTP